MEKHAAYIAKLIGKSKWKQLSEPEAVYLQAWLTMSERNRKLYAELQSDAAQREAMGLMGAFREDDIRSRILSSTQETSVRTASPGTRRLRKWLPYVAAVLVAATIVSWLYFSPVKRQVIDIRLAAADIQPGGNRATLTLADGRTINLDEAQAGIIVEQEDIVYGDGSSLALTTSGMLANIEELLLSTPKGGTYQVTLPDGSKVWLNAASSLKYPSRFGSDERVVELEGEAYFQVKSDRNRPFRVKSNEQYVSVLGTEFNILAYDDELETQTTLVEGSVEIFNRRSEKVNRLSPGEQGTIRGNAIAIQPVFVEKYIAWKEGRFHFRRTPFEELMRQIARWYDVEIVYNKGIPKETFSGEMSRNLTLKSVLELLNVSAVQVEVVDKRLIVN